MKPLLLTLAAAGWLLSVIGAVLDNRAGFDMTESGDGFFDMRRRPRLAGFATALIVGGATLGAAGTIIAVWVDD